jgi:tRNA(Ile)-lysidine synthase TilS/MesJ
MKIDLKYDQWKKDHVPTLEQFSDKQILVLYSGGKDSSVAMDLIARAGKEFGFAFQAHAGAYPVHRYTAQEKSRLQSYWEQRDVNIVWHDLQTTDEYIDALNNPCMGCQELRKKLMKRILADTIDDWNRLVLIVGYSLWDLVSYAVEHLLGSVMAKDDPENRKGNEKRFREIAQRFYPLLKMKEGYTIFRPLLKHNNEDIKKVLSEKNIPTLMIPCKYKDFRPKRILEKYYERMDLLFDYHKLFDFAQTSLNIPGTSSYSSIAKEEYLGDVF